MIAPPVMYLGQVLGTVVASRKVEGLEGKKLLLVQPVDEQHRPVGSRQVAVDTVRAGQGEFVYLVGSREAAVALEPSFVPVDAAIVGIVDDCYHLNEGASS
ncbi:MAG: EutN/CcmL family microcompartment protein [Myxococcota bacterium]|nr:EutN/CcmL family microcompartment protein [Myxococcota bacterium]